MNQYAAEIQLRGTFIDEITFRRTPGFSRELNNVSFAFALSDDSEYHEDTGQIVTKLVIEAKKGSESDELPFTFRIVMGGVFHVENADPQHLELMKKVNCPAILFPFLREAIASITRKAGFPPLYIPVINFAGRSSGNGPKEKQQKIKDE